MGTFENEDWTKFMKNYKTRLEKAFKMKGISGVTDFVLESLDKWKEVPLNIAVTGNSGAGKSSLINTLLGLLADDEGGAEIDVVECTTEPTSYKRKDLINLVIWDLPGIGTLEFTRENYLEKVEFQRYDCFIIVAASRFTDNDLWLAKAIKQLNNKEAQEVKKMFYFVRTKVDVDIASQRKGHRKKESEESILARIRSNTEARLKDAECENITSVFLIENYEHEKYDFDLLVATLVNDTQEEEKMDAMALSLTVLTENMIAKKKDAFKKRIWAICIASAAGGTIPVPGTSAAIDGMLLLNEAREYRRQFQLNDKDLSRVARILEIPPEDIAETLNLKSTVIVLTVKGITSLFSILVLSELMENAAKYTIPVIGSFVAGGVSFFSTKHCLESLLDMMVSDAQKINKKLKQKLKLTSKLSD